MSQRWERPGLGSAALYGVLAAIVGAVVTMVARLGIERRRGTTEAAKGLPDGPIIVISNHTSYADGLLLALACKRLGRPLRLLATASVFRAPIIGRLARRLGFIPVQRGEVSAVHALDAAADALEAGEAIGIYPEGRITRDPERWPERAKTGAVRLALRTGAPIVPVAMAGAHELVGRRKILWSLIKNLVRRPRVRVEVGDPIDVRALVGGDASPGPAQVRAAADHVMGELIALVAGLRDEQPEHPSGVPAQALPPRV
jgi:1-acyl-sn-glycerol-3-phosphate acyltransferase